MDNVKEKEIIDYLMDTVFNEDVYDVFPVLEDCYDTNPSLMVNIFMNFYSEISDLSKPIAKPFLDERSTYLYRKVYGFYDDGVFQTKKSIGEECNLTGVRVGQIIHNCNIVLINAIIREYNYIEQKCVTDNVPIEELGLSNGVYLKLKRLGIDYIGEIDVDSLEDAEGFGYKTIDAINTKMSRVRK